MASKDADAEQDLANRRRLRKDIRDRSELVNREMEELRSKPERARKGGLMRLPAWPAPIVLDPFRDDAWPVA